MKIKTQAADKNSRVYFYSEIIECVCSTNAVLPVGRKKKNPHIFNTMWIRIYTNKADGLIMRSSSQKYM